MAKRKKKTTPVQSIDIRIMDIEKEVNKTILRQLIQNAREAGCFGMSIWTELEEKTGIRAEFMRSCVMMSEDQIDDLTKLRHRRFARALREMLAEDQPLYDKDEARLADPQILDNNKYSSRAWRMRMETSVLREGRYAEEDDEIAEGGVTEDGVIYDRGGTDYDGRDLDADAKRIKGMWVKASYAVELVRTDKEGTFKMGRRLFSLGDLWDAWRDKLDDPELVPIYGQYDKEQGLTPIAWESTALGFKPRELVSGLTEHIRVKRNCLKTGIKHRVSGKWVGSRVWVATKLYHNRHKSEEDMAEWVRFARKFVGDAVVTLEERRTSLRGLDNKPLLCPYHRALFLKKPDKRYSKGWRLKTVRPTDCRPMLDWVVHAIESKGDYREDNPIGEALILAEDVVGTDKRLFEDLLAMAKAKVRKAHKADYDRQYVPKRYNEERGVTELDIVRKRQVAFMVFFDPVAAGLLLRKEKIDPETGELVQSWEEQDITAVSGHKRATGTPINPLNPDREHGPTMGRHIIRTKEGKIIVEELPRPKKGQK